MPFFIALQYFWIDNPELCIPPESIGGALGSSCRNFVVHSTPIYSGELIFGYFDDGFFR
jgi:hypothetical protein